LEKKRPGVLLGGKKKGEEGGVGGCFFWVGKGGKNIVLSKDLERKGKSVLRFWYPKEKRKGKGEKRDRHFFQKLKKLPLFWGGVVFSKQAKKSGGKPWYVKKNKKKPWKNWNLGKWVLGKNQGPIHHPLSKTKTKGGGEGRDFPKPGGRTCRPQKMWGERKKGEEAPPPPPPPPLFGKEKTEIYITLSLKKGKKPKILCFPEEEKREKKKKKRRKKKSLAPDPFEAKAGKKKEQRTPVLK